MLAKRIVACLDIKDGRVVKGRRFRHLRDSGDPPECARRYRDEGVNELVVLDVSATLEERLASLRTIERNCQGDGRSGDGRRRRALRQRLLASSRRGCR